MQHSLLRHVLHIYDYRISRRLTFLTVTACVMTDSILHNLSEHQYCYNTLHSEKFVILSSDSESPQNLSPDGIQTITYSVPSNQPYFRVETLNLLKQRLQIRYQSALFKSLIYPSY